MKCRALCRLALVFALLTPFLSSSAAQPNIVIFYADDLGWGELGAQGFAKDIPTPHIDSLAKNGLRFTNGYVAATYCSPSRAGLLTGRYPTRFGHEFNSAANAVGLRRDQTTLATRLQTLGYATAAIGKWHLGNQPENRPTQRGFDEFYGTLNNTPFFHPTNFIDSRLSNDVRAVTDPDFYTTDAYADRAVDWLERNKAKPCFLYLPFNAQHAPLEAPKKYLERFPEITDRKRQLFAAMMAGMDDAIGRVLAKIRALGQEENTLVFFISDNGGPTAHTTSSNGPLRGFKMTTFEGGTRVPFIVQWKGKIPAGKAYDLPVINLDVLPTAIAAAGGQAEASWKLDGVDLLPYLTGQNLSRPHQTLCWRYGPQWAIRDGDMKLVVAKGGGGQPELYDLAADIAESNDLAAAQPGKVKELQSKWEQWSADQAPASTSESGGGIPKKNRKKNAK